MLRPCPNLINSRFIILKCRAYTVRILLGHVFNSNGQSFRRLTIIPDCRPLAVVDPARFYIVAVHILYEL